MGAIAQFNHQVFVTRYPEFSSVDPDVLFLYWTEAELYHRNDGGGPVKSENSQQLLLNMLTAHVAQRNKLENGNTESDLVGRIDSASEGSVTVSAAFEVPAGCPQYFAQTKYGVDYWVATAPYRTFRYRRGPRRNFNPPFGGGIGFPFVR